MLDLEIKNKKDSAIPLDYAYHRQTILRFFMRRTIICGVRRYKLNSSPPMAWEIAT